MTSHPKVSVCIPAYRQPDLLRRCLESVFAQEFTDFEVIVTDDSADDSLAEVVADYASHANFRYQANPHPLGTPENWNEAVHLATGEYVKVMHHDDWLSNRQALGKYVTLLEEHPDAVFAFSGAAYVNGSTGVRRLQAASPAELRRLKQRPDVLIGGNFVGVPSATIYRAGTGLTYDRRFKWVVDFEFYIRMLRQHPVFAFTAEPLVSVTQGDVQQVSATCLLNLQAELGELLALYEKLSAGTQLGFYQHRFFWRIFRRFDIKNEAEIRQCGYRGVLPRGLVTLARLQGNPLIKAIFAVKNNLWRP